jgi:two-component system CheB/CheR fusion protein
VNKAVRDCCIFARQNVTQDPPFSKLDLISCRNVMIYFGSILQHKVLSIFHFALRPDGFLLLGSAETVGDFANLFDAFDKKHRIYRKKNVISRPHVDFDRALPAPGLYAEEQHITPVGAALREADRVLLARFTPAGVLINENMEILQFRGHTSRFLEPAPGTASFNLMKMVREGLLSDLRAAVREARKSESPARREGVHVKFNDHELMINLEVIPVRGPSNERFHLVLFEEPATPARKAPRGKAKKGRKPAESDSRQVARLKRELEATREYLQTVIEEQEGMNEELHSANEEIQSSNEELQSTNEELETAKEELQSTNEELTTLNDELEDRNRQSETLSNDLNNLLTSVEIPIVMLDRSLRLRRFNPVAERTLNFIPTDIGRPISDLKPPLQMENLDELIGEVVQTLEVRELEVRDRSGRLHSLRIRPYRTIDDKIDGAVLVLLDLEEFGKRRAAD